MPRALCLHGHFYQPPREHPWIGLVEPEPSALPYRDWNARITAECYAPNAAARVLDERGRLVDLVNTYEWTSFNFGPTLLAWLAPNAPDVLAALRRADAASRGRTGHGNAWAQAYGHPILPLSTPRDAATQARWGRRDFEHRFGRPPEGMWLPEMAVDRKALAALADAGIGLTLLAPHQARRVRPLGASDAAWTAVTPDTLDTRRLYRCLLDGGRHVDVAFRDAALSHDVAFGGLLADGAALARRLKERLAGGAEDALLTVAVDGETYGHHHRFGEMALAAALRRLAADPDVALLPPAAYHARVPPADEVDLVEHTSWSCPHGVARWSTGCDCRVSGPPEWSRAWRAPLRTAIDWLRDELAPVYEAQAGAVLRDPWGARDRYVDCVLAPGRTDEFLRAEAGRALRSAEAVAARRALELARNALLMQTSCGWFFDDLAGIEPVQILRYAARAIELAGEGAPALEDGFTARLAEARTNQPGHANGAEIFRRAARGGAAGPARVGATAAMVALLGYEVPLGWWDVELPRMGRNGRLRGTATVTEGVTGAVEQLEVVAHVADDRLEASAGGRRFGSTDLFGVQRERLVLAFGGDAAGSMERVGRAVLARARTLLEPLGSETLLNEDLSTLIGWEAGVDVVAALDAPPGELTALAQRLAEAVERGVRLPARWLAPRISAAVVRRLGSLPEGAAGAVALLDVARAGGLALDLSGAEVRFFAWWIAAPPAARADPTVAVLRERLNVSPPESAPGGPA
jgi:alpha-amylase/alpha-mannosidase (GH57 family)